MEGPQLQSHVTFLLCGHVTTKKISELPQYLWSPNFAKWVTYGWKTAHIKLHELFITRSYGKYKTLYLHFCSNYDQKFGQSSNLRRGTRLSMSRVDLKLIWR